MTGVWKYRKLSKSEKNQNPTQSVFFDSVVTGGITSVLVREAIQNSIDARIKKGKSPVGVRFALKNYENGLSSSKADSLLEGLKPHYIAENNGLYRDNVPDFSKRMAYLVIEDYNTHGLGGDPIQFKDSSTGSDESNDFYSFWRNVGRTYKQNDNLGRWGLGKAVFPKASKVHTYFGLTVRESESRALLMGECILNIHSLSSTDGPYNPYGYFGEFIDGDDEYFVSPISDDSSINSFIDDFNLERYDQDGTLRPGLSIVIPYPSEEISKSELIKSVVIQYFYPILRGNLEVTIEDDNSGSTIIKSDSINEAIKLILFTEGDKINEDHLLKLIKLTEYILNFEDEDLIKLNKQDLANTPQWRQDWLDNSLNEKDLRIHQEKYLSGEVIGVKIPVKVHEKGKDAKYGHFSVFLVKDDKQEHPDCHFIRDGVTLIGINPIRKNSVRALVIIEDSLLSQLLGDAENPAHTEWTKDSQNFKGKYEHGDYVLSFVINSINKLNSWLTMPAEGLEEDILEDIFYIETEESPEPDEPVKPSEPEDPTSPTPEPPEPFGEPSPIRINSIKDGIIVKANAKATVLPDEVEIKMAYVTSKGNPIKKYNPLDFNISNVPIFIDSGYVEIITCMDNLLRFKILKKEFHVELTGFDSERDLFVKAEVK